MVKVVLLTNEVEQRMPEVAMPGDHLGIEEEVLGDQQTYSEKGDVYSAVMGEKKLDGMELHIHPKKTVRILQVGDEVMGRVEDVYDSIALIVISPGYTEPRRAIGSSYAYLRISEISKGRYIENFRECLRIGDIVKAKVLDIQPLGTHLTLTEPGLGVVKAFCSQCRQPLQENGRILTCTYCGNKETRKLASVAEEPPSLEEQRRRPSARMGGRGPPMRGRGPSSGNRRSSFRGSPRGGSQKFSSERR